MSLGAPGLGLSAAPGAGRPVQWGPRTLRQHTGQAGHCEHSDEGTVTALHELLCPDPCGGGGGAELREGILKEPKSKVNLEN